MWLSWTVHIVFNSLQCIAKWWGLHYSDELYILCLCRTDSDGHDSKFEQRRVREEDSSRSLRGSAGSCPCCPVSPGVTVHHGTCPGGGWRTTPDHVTSVACKLLKVNAMPTVSPAHDFSLCLKAFTNRSAFVPSLSSWPSDVKNNSGLGFDSEKYNVWSIGETEQEPGAWVEWKTVIRLLSIRLDILGLEKLHMLHVSE